MRPLDLATLTNLVSGLPRFGRVQYRASVGSTNTLAVDRLHSDDNLGISFVTETQTAGRGRAGRRWESPPGAGIYVSTILPAELGAEVLPALGFWASLAAREACLAVAGVALDPKWPNDLLWEGKKCVGILCEGRSVGQNSRVVVGVGINVNRPGSVPVAIGGIAAWLSDATGKELKREPLLATLLAIYEREFDRLCRAPREIIADWARVAKLQGRLVSVKSADGSVMHTGTVLGLDPDGALLLETASGTARVTLGDVDAIAR